MQNPQKRLALNILAYAVQKRIDIASLCALSGLTINELRSESDSGLTDEQIDALWCNATELSKDPLFGLHFGESMQLAALGVVGELIRTSTTVGRALTQAATFSGLITNRLTMAVSASNNSFRIQFIPTLNQRSYSPTVFRQLMDFFIAFTLHEMDGLVLARIQPIAVRIPVDSQHLSEYKRVLRCGIIEPSDQYTIEFDQTYWDLPILTADYEAQSELVRKVSALSEAGEEHKSLRERITSFLFTNAYLGVPTLEAVASNLNVSSRSVQRRLQEEGVTYQQLVDSIRKSLALHYLQTGQRPVKEVSYILGYNELSAFHRAFRRWTGTTPINYQKGYSLDRNN